MLDRQVVRGLHVSRNEALFKIRPTRFEPSALREDAARARSTGAACVSSEAYIRC